MSLPTRRHVLLAGMVAATPILPALTRGPAMTPARRTSTNGIELAVRDVGAGPAVVLLHGFPGLSYSWRHQVPALVSAGYRVIVPDLRGYGDSDAPDDVEAYDIVQLTNDLAGLLDALSVDRAIFMGHDWGGLLAWQMPLFHPRRVAGVVSVSTPYIPHWMLWLHPELTAPASPTGESFNADPGRDPLEQMRRVYTPDMYVLMFNDDRRADTAMNADIPLTLRNSFRKDLMRADAWGELPSEVANMAYYGLPIPKDLPGRDVLTPDELAAYSRAYRRHGFTPPINWYRNLSRNWRIGRDMDQTIRVPSLMISGANDVVLRPSMTEGMHAFVPDLERRVVQDSWHWTAEDRPSEVNRLTTSWLGRRFPASRT
ncbi:MAG: alpha/beta hydrolase [Sphingomonas sp.]|nr:MAG: alpha/beta hydrolase [Sphingomonas sp.]